MAFDRWADVDRLFHAALARDPAERDAFLDDACVGDVILRREVESLLAHESAASEFLEQPALQQEAARLAGDATAGQDPQIPGFTIVRTLGEGGMGIVYLAQQEAPIHRQVALKLIKHGMDTRRVIARFEAEREALARMHHPHIAAVYDAGTTKDGRPYFVMEYVEGEPVTEYCDRRRLSTRARLELFTDVCGAVQHAHQKGVIHRDLKPSNVLVADADGRPQPKIIDFGVAKATGRSALGRTAFTEVGTIVGTPEYMSPEQAALSEDIDTATDVYSLGVLLYELLVGSLPFDPAMLRAAGFDEMRRIIRESDPARPSSRLTGAGGALSAATRQTDAGRLTRQLKGDLDWITLKALEKDRRLRYSTVAAFAADIGHYLADEPIAARAPSVAYRLRKFAQRYRGVVAAASVALIVLVAGLVVSLTQYVRAESQRVEADRLRLEADEQRAKAWLAASEASGQRNAAMVASGEADRQQAAAMREAAAAGSARREAEYRAYVASISAADAELRLNLASVARGRLLAVPPPLRGWEWQHLFFKTDTSLATFTSTPSPCAIPGAPALPGNNIYIGNGLTEDPRRARLYLRGCVNLDVWEGPDRAHATYTLPGKVLAVGPTGDALVVTLTGSFQARWSLGLVEPATGRRVREYGPFPVEPICADIDAAGGRFAVGFKPAVEADRYPLDDLFEVWDMGAGERRQRLAPPRPELPDMRIPPRLSCFVAFSPNSTRLATSGATVHVWQVDSGADMAASLARVGPSSQPIAWSPDGTRVAIGRFTGVIDVLDTAHGARVWTYDANGLIRVLPLPAGDSQMSLIARAHGQVLSVAFSSDGAHIVSGSDAGVGVWDVATERLTHMLAGHDAPVIGVTMDSGGRLVSADSAGRIKVWPASGYGATTVVPGAQRIVRFMLSTDGSALALAHTDGELAVWRLAGLQKTLVNPGVPPSMPAAERPPRITSIAIGPDGRDVLAGFADEVGTVRSWTIRAGRSATSAFNEDPGRGCENTNQSQSGVPWSIFPVNEMAVGPDDRTLAFRQGACIVIRDLASSTVLATLQIFLNAGSLQVDVRDFAFRPDGSLVITTFGPRRALIWDWKHGKVIREVILEDTGGWHASLSADGRTVVLFNAVAGIVSIWDGDLRREQGRLPVLPGLKDVALTADGRRLATSTANDVTVRVWDTVRRELMLVLYDDDQHLAGLGFTPDGRLLAGRVTGGVTIWDISRR